MKHLISLALASTLVCGPAYALLPEPGAPGAPKDARYCGEPARDAHGVIKRSMTERARFEAAWPMPKDGQVWYVDHVVPLVEGGCDLPFNMQWLPARLKTCAVYCKDRFEQKVYGTQPVP